MNVSDEELEAWLNQVHFGSCCGDRQNDCAQSQNNVDNCLDKEISLLNQPKNLTKIVDENNQEIT